MLLTSEALGVFGELELLVDPQPLKSAVARIVIARNDFTAAEAYRTAARSSRPGWGLIE
jgi:hypothetical protein